MLDKFKSRTFAIGALAFLAMAIVFVAHFSLTRETGTEITRMDAPDPVIAHAAAAARTQAEAAPVAEVSEPTREPAPVAPRIVTYEEAEAAYLARRYDEAVTLFTAYSERKSENPWGFYMLGLSAWKAGDPVRAEAAFTRSIELDDTHVKSYVNLSRVLLDVDRAPEALDRIDTALDLDPDNADARRVRGRVLHEIGNTEDAAAAYRDAIRLNEEDAWSMNNLALILINKGRYDEALCALARAIEIDADEPAFYNNLGMALECTGHFHEATVAYTTAVDIEPAYDKAAANLNRVATVLEEPGLEPVDLAAAAVRFTEQIATWRSPAVASDAVEVAAEANAGTIEPDSTTVGAE